MLKDMRRMHGGYVHMVDEVAVKQLWLRKGDELHQSTYLDAADGDYSLLSVQQALNKPQVIAEGKNSIRFSMPDEGFYNAYYTEQNVSDNILEINTAKAEILKHNCGNGHKYDRGLVKPQNWSDAPLDIIRLRQDDEDFHTRLRSGTDVKFKILHQGQPAIGAKVKLETNKGWIKIARTDDQGIATFGVIQDNFFDPNHDKKKPEAKKVDWKKLAAKNAEKKSTHSKEQKVERGHGGRIRVVDHYLVSAEYLIDQDGTLNNQPYQKTRYSVTSIGRYYPRKLASNSSAQGLLFTSAGMLVMGVGGYSYRKRRVKPFKEETFDEH